MQWRPASALPHRPASQPSPAQRGACLTHRACDCSLGPVAAVQDLPGVFSAREFVWWYNGHLQYRDLPLDLSATRSVAIAGLGNVAGAPGSGSCGS